MGSLQKEDAPVAGLVTSREPTGPKAPGMKGSMGDQALMDAVIIVGVAWAVLFLLAFSLRAHNI